MTIDSEKDDLRAQARHRRRELAAAEPEFGQVLVSSFIAKFDPQPETKIAGYWPTPSEADVIPLLGALHQRGCICLLPVVAAPDSALMFRHWQPGDDLAVSDLKISEPTPDKRLEIPDILLVPLLAFDNSGHRLGFGGGYYDRTLSDLRAKRDITAIGFAYAGQEVDNIPQESFDQRLDWVMTEQGLHKFNTDKVL